MRCSPYHYHPTFYDTYDSYEHNSNGGGGQSSHYMIDERDIASEHANGHNYHTIPSPSLRSSPRYAPRDDSSSLSPRRLPSSIPSKLRCSRCAVRYNRNHHQSGDKKFDLNVQNLRMTCGECYCVFYSCSSCSMPFKEQCDGDRHLRCAPSFGFSFVPMMLKSHVHHFT